MTYTVHENNEISIINFDGEDNDGYMFANTLGKLESISESEGRVAETVRIDGVEYDVRNKQNVFTYKLPL